MVGIISDATHNYKHHQCNKHSQTLYHLHIYMTQF